MRLANMTSRSTSLACHDRDVNTLGWERQTGSIPVEKRPAHERCPDAPHNGRGVISRPADPPYSHERSCEIMFAWFSSAGS